MTWQQWVISYWNANSRHCSKMAAISGLVGAVSTVTKSFFEINNVTIDNWTFKLFYKWSATLLIVSRWTTFDRAKRVYCTSLWGRKTRRPVVVREITSIHHYKAWCVYQLREAGEGRTLEWECYCVCVIKEIAYYVHICNSPMVSSHGKAFKTSSFTDYPNPIYDNELKLVLLWTCYLIEMFFLCTPTYWSRWGHQYVGAENRALQSNNMITVYQHLFIV